MIGLPFIIWAGLLAAPYWGQNLIELIGNLAVAFETPFQISICPNTRKTVLLFCVLYTVCILYILASQRNTRYGEEHGSAEWGVPKNVCKALSCKSFSDNRIFTANVRISYNFFKHQRNVNTTVVGGSGAKKTRGYVMPNIMQNNCSNIILDPMGEILAGCGKLLESEGTQIKVLDLIEMDKSNHYNPFCYLRDEKDVQTMVSFMFTSTTPSDSKSNDPFWDQAAEVLLKAICFYLWLEAPPEEQTFAMVMEMLRCTALDDNEECIADVLFDELERRQPDHVALKYWRDYRNGSEKTLKSIQLVLAAHLEKFNLPALATMTADDTLELRSLGETKTALFLRLSDSDKSFNFIASMLYTQVIQQLFECADLKYHGRLPVHVHLMMDEFANVALPQEFESYLSTMRKRNMSASIILQNIAQLKSLFKESKWESILGNCDELLYLGGNEQSTHEYISKQLGSETIWTRSNNLSHGRNGSYSRNDSTIERKLMTPDEVRSLDNDHAILFIRGYPPLCDLKYDLNKHPKIKQTVMGGGIPYEHGKPSAVTNNGESQESLQNVEILTKSQLEENLGI